MLKTPQVERFDRSCEEEGIEGGFCGARRDLEGWGRISFVGDDVGGDASAKLGESVCWIWREKMRGKGRDEK